MVQAHRKHTQNKILHKEWTYMMQLPLNYEQREQITIPELSIILFRQIKKTIEEFEEQNQNRGYQSEEPIRLYLPSLQEKICPENPTQGGSGDPSFFLKFYDAAALLKRRGLLMDGFDSRYSNRSCICLTSVGEKSDVDGDVLLLIDNPEEIVTALEQKIGRLDDIVRQYYLESLRAYQGGLYISSVICLGAASERSIHWLAEAIEANFQHYQTNIQAKKKGQISALTKYLSDSVIPNISNFDKRSAEELKNRLNGLAGVYRENRNDAGHPTTVEQSWLKDDQEILLLHFRRYITTISAAIVKCYPKSGVATTV